MSESGQVIDPNTCPTCSGCGELWFHDERMWDVCWDCRGSGELESWEDDELVRAILEERRHKSEGSLEER